MKTWQKVGIGVGAAVVLGGIVLFSVNQANKGVVTVQTAKVAPQETLVSQVTASGEIKPTDDVHQRDRARIRQNHRDICQGRRSR